MKEAVGGGADRHTRGACAPPAMKILALGEDLGRLIKACKRGLAFAILTVLNRDKRYCGAIAATAGIAQ